MRVLVTGFTGFVGPHLTARLTARGASVIGFGPESSPPTGVSEWRVADLHDPASVAAAVRDARPDAIVHLAAQSSAARSFEAPSETFEINALGTWRLLEAVRTHASRARVLLVSTGEVYGPQPEGSRVAESAPLRPNNPYAFSKAAAEAMAEVAGARWQLDVVRIRSFGHTGVGQTSRFVVPAIAEQIARAELAPGEGVVRVGNLDVVRDLSDVRDVVEGYLAVLDRGIAGEVYNLCRGEGTRLADLAAGLAGRARRPVRIEVDPSRFRPADTPWLVGDPARITQATGWQARIPLDQTLDDVLDDWRKRVPLQSA